MAQLPLRPNVCMLVFNKQAQIFLGERAGSPGIWQLPQGGVKKSMSPEENVIEELYEELGAERECFRIVQKLEATHEYEFQNPPPYAINKWRGQAQSFWIVEYLGDDEEIKLDRFDAEFSDWKWSEPEKLLDQVDPVRRSGYQAPLAEFIKWRDQKFS